MSFANPRQSQKVLMSRKKQSPCGPKLSNRELCGWSMCGPESRGCQVPVFLCVVFWAGVQVWPFHFCISLFLEGGGVVFCFLGGGSSLALPFLYFFVLGGGGRCSSKSLLAHVCPSLPFSPPDRGPFAKWLKQVRGRHGRNVIPYFGSWM